MPALPGRLMGEGERLPGTGRRGAENEKAARLNVCFSMTIIYLNLRFC